MEWFKRKNIIIYFILGLLIVSYCTHVEHKLDTVIELIKQHDADRGDTKDVNYHVKRVKQIKADIEEKVSHY